MTTLLDVNVLIALVDPNHVHHDIAHAWFLRGREDWATCAITENGLVRIISQARYANAVTSPAVALDLLSRLKRVGDHTFWSSDVSLTDASLFSPEHFLAPQQVTDTYLLGLAVRRGGRLATFDRKLVVAPVRRGQTALLLL